MELQEIPFELNRLYNLDSEKAIKRIQDKFFELAIIDPPYGIGENGTKNHTRSKLAESKDYKSYAGNDNACELAWTSFKSAVRIFRFRWAGMLQGDMKNKEIRIHPNQKPVALYQWIINKFAAPGDKIIDTHAGSGSCLIAAHKTQHKFLGFELDKTYYTLADKRLRDEMAQLSIFDFMGGGS